MPGAGPPLPLAQLRVRLAALTGRERLFLAGGAVVFLLFLLHLLRPADAMEKVELRQAARPAVRPAPVSAPAPPPSIDIAPPPTAPADPSLMAGLTLLGVMGGGPSGGAAIIAGGDGVQRVVRVGREVAPGLELRQVGVKHAIASSGGGDLRLELNKAGGVAVAAAAPGGPLPVDAAARQREALTLRLGLVAQKVSGHTRGFVMRAGAAVPLLQRAGLRPGDLLVSVNGEPVDSEERLLNLPYEISDSSGIEIEYERNGRRSRRHASD